MEVPTALVTLVIQPPWSAAAGAGLHHVQSWPPPLSRSLALEVDTSHRGLGAAVRTIRHSEVIIEFSHRITRPL